MLSSHPGKKMYDFFFRTLDKIVLETSDNKIPLLLTYLTVFSTFMPLKEDTVNQDAK